MASNVNEGTAIFTWMVAILLVMNFQNVQARPLYTIDPVITAYVVAKNTTCHLHITIMSPDTSYHVRIDEILFPNEKNTEIYPLMVISSGYQINAVGLDVSPSTFGSLTALDDREMVWLSVDYVTPAKYKDHTVSIIYELPGLQSLIRRRTDIDSIALTLAEITPGQYDKEIHEPSGVFMLSDPNCVMKFRGESRHSYSSNCINPCVQVHDDVPRVTHRIVPGYIRREYE
ncbi:MAG TPA: hypothetical protein DIS79_08610 [Bacteroidetes bacterium]|nr:hypothetical protein [Bacteroidota bacterium]